MTAPAIAEVASAQRERLAYIEFRLWFFGEVIVKHIVVDDFDGDFACVQRPFAGF